MNQCLTLCIVYFDVTAQTFIHTICSNTAISVHRISCSHHHDFVFEAQDQPLREEALLLPAKYRATSSFLSSDEAEVKRSERQQESVLFLETGNARKRLQQEEQKEQRERSGRRSWSNSNKKRQSNFSFAFVDISRCLLEVVLLLAIPSFFFVSLVEEAGAEASFCFNSTFNSHTNAVYSSLIHLSTT